MGAPKHDDALPEIPNEAPERRTFRLVETAPTHDDAADTLRDSNTGDARSLELQPHQSHKRRITRTVSAPTTIPEDLPLSKREMGWRLAVVIAAGVIFGALVTRSAIGLFAASTPWLSVAIGSFGLVVTAYFLATVYHALRYKPVSAPGDRSLPMVTVIVPAYNEGVNVRVALESAVANDYPRERLEILAIDDGSKDDTWEHIQAVAEQHPGVIIAIKQPQNGGKREALRTGFERAAGEIIVTVDSDSKLEPTAIRNIIAPMVRDAEVAAVAGRVLVLNRDEHWWTRLLSARFYLTFDLARAAQSRFGAVLCTPGALSAYRKSAVDQVLEKWSSQTFFGQPCTIAEDRALTTWLLRSGYRSVYQRTAVVRTIMPVELRKMARMLVRWERGNIREDIVMLPLLFTKWRTRDQWWPTLEIVLELVQYPFAWLGLGLLVSRVLDQPMELVAVSVAVLFSAVVQSLYILRSRRGIDFVYGVLYGIFAFVGLQWVFPYSLVTVRDGRWMTR